MNELTLSRSGRAYVLLVVAVGVFVPLLVLTYASSKLSTARVEEANKHLAELSHLYLSTIEALALTIDAKDQVTSGHIRRVQIHSVAVARRLGVSDDKQVKAIEASALLHDLGKLAIPEHILNKPGKLTPARNVGRSWLSGGTHRRRDSIGARILSVVDCFDALISDRPYRRAMTKDQAITLIRGRSGSHYDSHIVDTFVGMVDELLTLGPLATAEETAKAAEIRYIVVPSSRTTPMVSPARASATSSGEPSSVTSGLDDDWALPSFGEISRYLESVVPGSVGVLYLHQPTEARLVVAQVSSPQNEFMIRELSISLGDRLSGWVGANRQTIHNSDPALDLFELAKTWKPPLRSCFATPLLQNDALRGVLSVYSSDPQGLTQEQVKRVSGFVAQGLEVPDGERDSATSPPVAVPRGPRRVDVEPAGPVSVPA